MIFKQTGASVFVSLRPVSKRVILICLLLCLAGFFSGWQLSGVLLETWRDSSGWWPALVLAGGFLCLPAGVGILMGYPLGRNLAVLAFCVGYFVCAALLAAPLLETAHAITINGSPAGFGVHATGSLMLLGVLLLLHWTLYSPPFEEHLA